MGCLALFVRNLPISEQELQQNDNEQLHSLIKKGSFSQLCCRLLTQHTKLCGPRIENFLQLLMEFLDKESPAYKL